MFFVILSNETSFFSKTVFQKNKNQFSEGSTFVFFRVSILESFSWLLFLICQVYENVESFQVRKCFCKFEQFKKCQNSINTKKLKTLMKNIVRSDRGTSYKL